MTKIHLAAFVEQVDQTLDNIAAISDGVLFTSGDDLVLPAELRHLAGISFQAANFERGRIVAPSLRGKVLPDIAPGTRAIEGAAAPLVHWWPQQPFELQPSERLNVQVENDAAAGAVTVSSCVWLTDGPINPAPARWFPLRATTTAAAATARGWSAPRTLSLAQSLPPGRYEMGGAWCYGATDPIAFRFIFPGQGHRPGWLAVDSYDEPSISYPHLEPNRYGNMGVWGEFTHDQPPTLELLYDAATNEAQELILDVRKVA